MDSVFCAGETHAIHLCGVVFGVPAICDGTSGPAPMSTQPMLPVQRGNELNEALSSFSDLSEVGQIWWLHLVVTLWLVVLGDSEVAIPSLNHSWFLFLASPAPVLMASSCPEETRRTRLPWLSSACKSLKPEIDASGLSFPDAPLTSIDPLA